MKLVDSHCHLDQLDLSAHQGSLDAALHAAQQQGVTHFLCVCIDMNNVQATLDIARRHTNIFASVGVHPSEQNSHDPDEAELISLASESKVVALGETGLDYYRVQGDISWQQARFRRHIHAAQAVNKPLIVHTRDARADTIRILQEENAQTVGGVLHCFTESLTMAQQAMELGFYISFSGIITFKNAVELQEVVKHIPLERILIETDSPYLAPVPYRGKPNEPAYVRYVAEKVAELKQIDVETVAKQTTANFFNLFQAASA
jgi:TatD DNase family protein